MGFFEEYKRQIITIISVILIITAIITAGKRTNATFVDNALGFVITPIQKITTSVGNWFSDRISAFRSDTDLAMENEDLKAQIDLLESEITRLTYYEKENEKLTSLLDITQKYVSLETIAAYIIGKDPGNWYNSFLIDKGTNNGISSNMVLMNSNGLIGKIIETGYGYSKSISIIDSRSSVSAMSLRTEDLGIVRGDYSLMNDGLCIMEYIDIDAEIMKGDEIVTSQISEFPAGIPIGVVKEVETDSNNLTKYAIIEPYVDFKHLDTVLIVIEDLDKP